MNSKYWEQAQDTINRIQEIPKSDKAIKTEERFVQYISDEILEIVKVMSVVGRDKLVENAIINALDNCPKNIRDNFVASLLQIFNRIKRKRKEKWCKK